MMPEIQNTNTRLFFQSIFFKSAKLGHSLILITIFFLSSFSLSAQFITTWKTTTPNESIAIPTNASETYNYTVDWGDGTTTTGETGDATHIYATAGDHTVTITGLFPHIYFANGGDKDKIIAIDQWGTNPWTSMYQSFFGCSNLAGQASDAPNLANATSLSYMFYLASSFNQNINNWDVSTIRDMSNMFIAATSFTSDLDLWNTSEVTTMFSMFKGATAFNGDISTWDVRKVKTMGSMFNGAIIFNGNIGGWKTDALEGLGMSGMFQNAEAFNTYIGDWNVSAVDDMVNVFNGVKAYNKPLTNWDTGNVTKMRNMFKGAKAFNKDLSNLNTANVETMNGMFSGATIFNGKIDNWNTAKVDHMGEMFTDAKAFNRDIGNWNTSLVERMNNMFEGATSFDKDISSWNVSEVWTMRYMFRYATAFNNDNAALTWASGTGTSKVEKMDYMFYGASSFNQDIGSWDVSKVQTMNNMFYDAILFNQDIGAWDVSEVTDMNSMLYNAKAFNNNGAALTWTNGTGTSKVTGMIYMLRGSALNQDISTWDVSSVKKMSYMFQDASNFDQNLEDWDITGLTEAPGMFDGVKLSTANYEKLLISWAAQNVNTNVVFSGGNSTYCSPESVTAHTTLETKWTITDGGNTGCTVACSVPTSERDALMALYNSTDGANWTDNTNWNTTAPVKDWFGVTVDCANNTVTEINLTQTQFIGNNLVGTLPAEIKNLTNLEVLDLSHNKISGSIIPEIYDLAKLETLELNDNLLEGGISTDIDKLVNLQSLLLRENPNLGGPIPKELGNMAANLAAISLGNCGLTGTIPEELWNLNKLRVLNLGNNNLNSTIPTTNIANLTELSSFFIDNNNLTGSIPADLAHLPDLDVFHINNNEFTGAIPNFTSITIQLLIENNKFQFGDFENEFNSYTANILLFDDSPQAKVNTIDIQNKNTGDNTTMTVTCSGSQNNYQWYKGTTALTNTGSFLGAQTATLQINNIQLTDAGVYHCRVTSDIVTDLTIYRNDVTLNVTVATLSPNDFVTTWKTTTPNESITIPTFTGETYNYTVDWGDGSTDATTYTGNATHTYTTAGDHMVRISGTFPRIFFNGVGDKDKIISIDQWGDKKWTSMNSAFKGCSKLAGQASDAPDLLKVDDLSYMFSGCSIFDQNIGDWNTSEVITMKSMFSSAQKFNQDISTKASGAWNTSKVKNMSWMFTAASSFDKNIGNWNTNKVENMESMFQNASKFNQNIGLWNTSQVKIMHSMFFNATKFDKDISYKPITESWNTSAVTSMRAMFQNAVNFNKNIGNWKTGAVTDMSEMFNRAIKFDQNLEHWDVTGLQNSGGLKGAENMFRQVKLSTANYDALLKSWSAQNLNPGVNFSGGKSQYCTAEAERAILDSKWGAITDAGKDVSCGAALTCPTISSSTTDLDLLPTITWSSVTGATIYRVLVVKKSDGTQIVNETLGDVSTYTLTTSLEENTIYQVTIFASDGTTETTGCTAVEVETKTTTVGLTCPIISSSTTDLDLLPTITWNSITGATIYRVLVVKKSDGTQIVNETLGDVSTYTLTTSLEENTIYQVTIFASDGTTETTGCTAVEVETKTTTVGLTCPTITSATTNMPLLPTIKWNKVTGASAYRIVIIKVSDNSEIINKILLDISAYTITTSLEEGTEYTVTIYASNAVDESPGCNSLSFTTVINSKMILADAGEGKTIDCNNETIQIGGVTTSEGDGITYSWSTTDGNIISGVDMKIAIVDKAGTYTLAVSKSGSSTVSDDVVIHEDMIPPTVTVSDNVTINLGDNTTLSATGGERYLWLPSETLNDPNIANPIATPTQNTTYTVTVITSNGCENSADVTVTVIDNPSSHGLIIPDGFSPNGDGVNEVWEIKGIENYPKANVYIVNRWGNKVYSTNKVYEESWDGTYKNNRLSSGVYFYVLKLGTGRVIKGHINLIK